jgi:hypothetical protein
MKKYGLDLSQSFENRTPEDFVFGASPVPFEVLQEDGSWLNHLPPLEWQSVWGNVAFETSACATYGTLNALEILIDRKYGREADKSDRWLATVSGTTMQGNSPHKIGETLRKLGVPKEGEWPSLGTQNATEYYQKPTDASYKLARRFLDRYNIKHEYVAPDKASVKEALKTSPLGVSVYAWIKQGDRYVHPPGATDNHYCVMVDCNDEYFIVFDTYEDDGSPLKKVSWDYAPAIIKRYYIEENMAPLSGGNWVQNLWKNLVAFVRDLWTMPIAEK